MPDSAAALAPLLASLRRAPDVEADNLYAVDATDRLLLDAAAESLAAHPDLRVLVVGDTHGALTLGACELGAAQVAVWQDPLVAEQALAANTHRWVAAGGHEPRYRHIGLEAADYFAGFDLVLLQLPRSLSLLDALAGFIAAGASPATRLVAGARVKHMEPSMTRVLERHFASVHASLARQKSRLLIAENPLIAQAATASRLIEQARIALGDGDPALTPLTVCAFPGGFAGASLDIGTRALVPHVAQAARSAVERAQAQQRPARAIDLGCGTGVLAAVLARASTEIEVIATDQMRTAVASAMATMAANGLDGHVHVVRDTLLDAQPDASADLIVCNPPFHVGAAVHTGVAQAMFASAARVLRPGGQLLVVFNSHLRYRPTLQRSVGPTEQLSRDAKFTVTRSTRR